MVGRAYPLRPGGSTLTPGDLRALDEYKYTGVDYSLSSKYFMQPYWTWAVQFVPRTIAPNLITLTGFAISCSTSVIEAYYALNGEEIPQWVWLYAAIALFAYQTLDALDGKQARRTGCGSPLGELFDHGCDALFTPLINVTITLALGFTPLQSFMHCFLVNSTLFFGLFEQFSTGTLDLGYINGPVEGILVTVSSLLTAAVMGPAWWAAPFAGGPLVDFGSVMGVELAIRRPNDLLFLLTVVSTVSTGLTNVQHAIARPVAHGKIDRVTALVPHLVIMGLVAYLGWTSPGLWRNGAFPFAIDLAYGWFVSFTVTRLTIARLCRKVYDPFTMPYRLMVVASVTLVGYKYLNPKPTENSLLLGAPFAACAVLTIVNYLWMASKVCRSIANHLGIHVLTMTDKQYARNVKPQS